MASVWGILPDDASVLHEKRQYAPLRNLDVVNRFQESVLIKSLKAKKTYYVRIRTYVTGSDGKKIYSNWSSKKKITTL